MSPVVCLLDTGADLNLVNASMIPPQWAARIKRQNLPRLRTATKEPLALDGTIILHLRLGDLRVRVCFGVVPNLVVDFLLGTSFSDRFIRGIFPSERKIVPWHSHPVTILASQRPSATTATNNAISAIEDTSLDQAVTNDQVTHPILVARQMVIPANTASSVLVTTAATGLFLVQPRIMRITRQTTIAARRILDAPPNRPFFILVSNFSNRPVHLRKHMVLAHSETPPSTFFHFRSDVANVSPIGSPEEQEANPQFSPNLPKAQQPSHLAASSVVWKTEFDVQMRTQGMQ